MRMAWDSSINMPWKNYLPGWEVQYKATAKI
jgi:hypothetical protein